MGVVDMKRPDDIDIQTFNGFNCKHIVIIPVIAVYKHPKDYPDKYVARLWDIHKKATRYIVTGDSLEHIRSKIPDTMHRLPPTPVDDPVIVETWI
jgi:hypothetical protein